MAFTLNDLLDGVRSSRKHFLKHVAGVTEEQWDWKPYPECKSLRETLVHLIIDDRAALSALQEPGEPNYEGLEHVVNAEAGNDLARLHSLLEESHAKLLSYIQDHYGNAPLDTEVSIFGSPMKLGAVSYLSAEDYSHAGPAASLRQ